VQEVEARQGRLTYIVRSQQQVLGKPARVEPGCDSQGVNSRGDDAMFEPIVAAQ
jgi:hypothetical protein